MNQMNEIKYILDNPDYGIEYDFKFIRKEYKKLKCPPEVYNPCTAPLEQAKYFVETSERNIGKTTNWLLFGMIMNKFYGTIIQYVRQTENMIMPKSLSDLFKTILEYHYIEKITDGQYNTVVLKSRRYYYALADENGKIIERAVDHFMFCCCVEKATDLKSSYNAPRGDLIIYDEFIGKYYYPNEFVQFEDLTKTIIRGRRSPFIVMLANTINPHSAYYNELEIYDDIQAMKIGDHRLITTFKGTRIYVEIIGATPEKKKLNDVINKLFYGFRNPMLGSITGENWAIKNYQHLPEVPEDTNEDEKHIEVISRQLYIFYNNKYVRLDILQHYDLGVIIYVQWASRTYEDSIIFTAEERHDRRYMYKMGHGKLERFIKRMLSQNRFYYATNDTGSFVESYLTYISKLS